MQKEKIDYEIGEHSEKVFDCDLMVVSPGVPSDAEVIKNAKVKILKLLVSWNLHHLIAKQILLELQVQMEKQPQLVCAVISLMSVEKNHILRAILVWRFQKLQRQVKENEFVSLEISSFQLDLIDRFKPKVA